MKKLTLFLALCMSAQAFGQAARFDGVAQSTRLVNGITLTIPLPSATITVYNFGTTTKASVCPDITATSCTSSAPNNPVTSDAQGNFGFWIAGGVYDYTVTPSSGTVQGPYHAVVPFGANSSGSVTYSKNFENIRFVDQYAGSVFSAKQIACNSDAISVTGGTCDAYAVSGAQTISAETPVGNTSGNSVQLRLPPYILATVTGTDGTSCGLKLYDKSSIIGPGTGGSSNTQILGQNGTNVDSLFCTDGSSGGQYVNAEGIELFNPTGSTAIYANALANIQHLFDNSHLSRIFTRAPGVTGFFAHDFCCGTLMEMIGSNGFGVASSIPCSIGKNGEHSNGILIGFSCVHPGDTKNAFILNSSGTSYSALDMLGSYTECNSTDTTTPLFQLNGGANDSIGMYGVAIAGPACAGGTTAYLIDIAAAMKGGILTNIRRGGLSRTINDHVNSRTSTLSYIPLYTFGGADYFSSFILGSSSVTLAGTTGTGTSIVTDNGPTITSNFSVSDTAGTNRQLNFNTAGVNRWIVRTDNTAEGGANSGSNFVLSARDDTGALLFTALSCTRSSGQCSFPQALTTASIPSPGAIGGTTPAAGTFTTLAATTFSATTINDGQLAGQNAPKSVYVTSAYTNATTTFSNVTNLSFAVGATTNYHATCRVTWQGSANTAGPKYQFTGPAAPTAVAVGMNSVVTATTVISASAVAFSSPVANSGAVTATTNFTDTIDIGVVNGANAGTVQLQAAANGVGTLTIQPGSYCSIQ